MGRTYENEREDMDVLERLHVGDDVVFTSKEGTKFFGKVRKINEYAGYDNYSSVTIGAGKSHKNVSPRNIRILNNLKTCISLKMLYESGHEFLEYGGRIEYTKEDDKEFFDLYKDELLLCDGEEIEIIELLSDGAVVVKALESDCKIWLSQEEFAVAVFM